MPSPPRVLDNFAIITDDCRQIYVDEILITPFSFVAINKPRQILPRFR